MLRTVMTRCSMAALVLELAAAALSGAAAQEAVLFRAARVFDGSRVLPSADVLVRNGRIAEVGQGLAAPAGATVIAAAGKTLLPGFIDSHTHAWGEALTDALAFGVTTELDMFADARMAAGLRAEQQKANVPRRADLFSAGTLVTAPRGHGTQFGTVIPTLTSPDSAQAFVDARIAEGSDYIKIVYDDGRPYGIDFPTISGATLRAAIAAAHKRGKLAVVHIGSASAAREAIDAGADGLVHLFTNAPPLADFAALASAKGAFVIPTLVVLSSIAGEAGAQRLADDERLAPYISPAARTSAAQTFPVRTGAPPRSFAHALATVQQLKAAGVRVLAGTDAPNPGTAHGASMHQELKLLVDAGLTPAEALAAATSVPAQAFRLADRGRIAAGLRADLILVNGDPTTDITATRAVEGVWKGGVRFDRAAYAANVAAQLKAASAAPTAVQPGLVADFETGTATAAFGTAWVVNTDSYAGGQSTGELAVASEGAHGSKGSLRITGVISNAVPYAWSGAMWSPGAQIMAPADLSATKELRFMARGDGKTYRVIVFAQSKGMNALMQSFRSTATWSEVVIPWSAFGIDAHDLMGVIFSGGPEAGAFSLQIDDVRVK